MEEGIWSGQPCTELQLRREAEGLRVLSTILPQNRQGTARRVQTAPTVHH